MEWHRIKDRIRGHGIEAISILGLIVFWQLVAAAVNDTLLLPSFFPVLAAFSNSWRALLVEDLPVSLIHFGLGLAAGLLIALPIGMLMGWSRAADRVLDPIVEI